MIVLSTRYFKWFYCSYFQNFIHVYNWTNVWEMCMLDFVLPYFNAVIHNSCYVFREQLNFVQIIIVVHLETYSRYILICFCQFFSCEYCM